MAGDQKSAAQIRTENFLKKDPLHFKKLAAKRKGTPNPSATKFTSRVAAKFGAKGGKAGAGKKKRRTKEEIIADNIERKQRIDESNKQANDEYQEEMNQKIIAEGFKGDKS